MTQHGAVFELSYAGRDLLRDGASAWPLVKPKSSTMICRPARIAGKWRYCTWSARLSQAPFITIVSGGGWSCYAAFVGFYDNAPFLQQPFWDVMSIPVLLAPDA